MAELHSQLSRSLIPTNQPSPPVVEITSPLTKSSIAHREHASSYLLQQTVRYAESCGELVARIILLPEHSEKRVALIEDYQHRSKRLHTMLERQIHSYGSSPEEQNYIRAIQDRRLYQTLRDAFIRFGIELGESQAREIDHKRYARSREKIEDIENRVLSFFSYRTETSTPLPYELQVGSDKTNPLCIALRAAVRQGEKIGMEHRIHAEIDAAHLYKAIAGWKEYLPTWITHFKPFQEVCHILQHKSRASIGYINQAFTERCGENLFDNLVNAYGKNFGAKISWLLSGDNVATAAHVFAQELKNWFVSKRSKGETARQLYERIPANDLGRFETIVAHELKIPKNSLVDWIALRIPSIDAQKLQAFRDKDPLREKVIHLHDILERKPHRRSDVRLLFREFDTTQIDRFAEKYQSLYGHSLHHALETKLLPSAAKDLCLAIAERDTQRIQAAKLRCALEYKADWIGAPFLKTTQQEREQMISSYNNYYHQTDKGSFWSDLRQAVWKDDYGVFSYSPTACKLLEKLWWPCTNSYPFIESLALNGELKPAELLRYFMIGLGTDVRGIYSVLSNRSEAEIAEISADYAARYKPGFATKMLKKVPFVKNFLLIGELKHDLNVELSGDHNFDISLFCKGLSNSKSELAVCTTMYENLQLRYQYERGGVLMRNGWLSSIRGDRLILKRLEEDFQAATLFYQEHIENKDSLSPETIKRFCTLTRLVEVQANAYREAKTSLSSLVLNSGAFIGASLGIAASLLCAPLTLWTAAPSAALGSLGWRWLQGRLLLGDGFGRTDATFQMIRALIDGASIFTGRAGISSLGKFLGNQISNNVVKSGFKSSLHRFVRTIEERIGYQDKARHLLEQGDLLASDEELLSIDRNFVNAIAENDKLMKVQSLQKRPTAKASDLD